LFAALLVGQSPSAMAAMIVTQEPCANSPCVSFNEDDANPIPVIRSAGLNAPSAGTAMIRFHGSLNCFNEFLRPRVVDVVSQIVLNVADTPDPNGPGGLRHAINFARGEDPFFGGLNKANTFSLRSTRVVQIAGPGPHTFHFKIARLRMDSSTSCAVYNAAFSIVFVP
jgi:hypothetical protein